MLKVVSMCMALMIVVLTIVVIYIYLKRKPLSISSNLSGPSMMSRRQVPYSSFADYDCVDPHGNYLDILPEVSGNTVNLYDDNIQLSASIEMTSVRG